MINKIFPKLAMLTLWSLVLSFISIDAVANTAPVFNYTDEKKISTYTIEPDIDSTDSFIPVDMDGDGDLDILLLSRDAISWYENGNDWDKTYIINSNYGYNDIMAVGDMDGDGDVDIITSSSTDNEIYLYENDYQWTKTPIVNDIEYVNSIKINDMDGDGDLDIVVLGGSNILSQYYTDDVIIWYENGNSWAENRIKLNGYEPNEIVVADMDGDGDFDVLYTNDSFNKIAWLENENGNVDLWSENIISSSYDVEDIKVVDVDLDGDLDLLVGEEDAIHWLENGNSWTKTSIVTGVSDLEGLDFSDINGDGEVDILSAYKGSYRSSGAINLYQGLNWSDTVISNRSNIQPKNVVAVDMDNDGDMDVVSRSYNYSNYNYLISMHTLEGYDTTIPVSVGVLEGELDIPLPLLGHDDDGDPLTYSLSGDDSEFFKVSLSGVVSFITASDYHLFSDFNKDNIFEVILNVSDGVLSSSKKIKIEVLLGQDSDTDGITDAQELLDGTDPYDYDSKIDTDGDGVPDRLEIYYGGDINSPDAIDSDGDGVSDYIEQYYGEDEAPVWLSKVNNAEHWVKKEVPSTSATTYHSHNALVVADMTGDGVKDILSQYDNSLVIYDRANNFSAFMVDDDVYGTQFITVADLSNNGVNSPDIITIGGRYNNDIYWYEHSTWIKRPISTSSDYYGDIKAEDMDSDGDLDIVAITNTQVVWFENGNTWLEHSLIDYEGVILRFEMIDFDLDGDTDFVAGIRHNYDTYEVVWFENGASWEKHVIINSVDEPDGLAVKDIDGDGSLDIVVTSNDNSFTLLQNIDGWKETKLYSLYSGDNTSDVVITDMNNDGVLDIVGSSSSSLVWFNGANDWSRIVINPTSEKIRIIVEDLIGDSNKDVIGSNSSRTPTYGSTGLFIYEATNIVTKYSLEVPDLSPEIKLPFVALDPDGQDLTYILEGDDANYFTVDKDGVISFASQLSIGTPVDFDGDNVFDLYLIAYDGKTYSIVYLSLTLIKSIDTDGDGILDSYDIDDDNDLVPDAVEIEEGTDPLDANSFLDEDRNGVPDFVQRSEAQYINYQFPLGVSVDEGGFAVIDLSNVTSVNGPVSVDVGEVQGLNYKFRDNVLYIYADYVNSNQTINIDVTLSDGVELIEHVFTVFVVDYTSDSLKIELIREATAINDGIRLQVAVKNILAPLDFKWYIDGELLTSENSQIFTLQEHHFTNEDVVVKVEVSNDGFVSKYTDGMELNRTSFLAEVAQAEQLESEPSTKNVAGSTSVISLVFAISLLLLRRIKLKIVKPRKVLSTSKLILTILMMFAITACSSTTDTNQHQLSPQLSAQTQTVNISLDETDPLYIAKQEYETGKEQAKLEKLRRKIELEVKERNERVHILTIGF